MADNVKQLWKEYVNKYFGGPNKVIVQFGEEAGFSTIDKYVATISPDRFKMGELDFKLESPELEDGDFVLYTGLKKRRSKNTFSALSELSGVLGSSDGKQLFDKFAGLNEGEPCYKWIFTDEIIYKYELNDSEDMFVPTDEFHFRGEEYDKACKVLNIKWPYWGKTVTAYCRIGDNKPLVNLPLTVTANDDELLIKFPASPEFKGLQYVSDCLMSLYGGHPKKGLLKIVWYAVCDKCYDPSDPEYLLSVHKVPDNDSVVKNVITAEDQMRLYLVGRNQEDLTVSLCIDPKSIPEDEEKPAPVVEEEKPVEQNMAIEPELEPAIEPVPEPAPVAAEPREEKPSAPVAKDVSRSENSILSNKTLLYAVIGVLVAVVIILAVILLSRPSAPSGRASSSQSSYNQTTSSPVQSRANPPLSSMSRLIDEASRGEVFRQQSIYVSFPGSSPNVLHLLAAFCDNRMGDGSSDYYRNAYRHIANEDYSGIVDFVKDTKNGYLKCRVSQDSWVEFAQFKESSSSRLFVINRVERVDGQECSVAFKFFRYDVGAHVLRPVGSIPIRGLSAEYFVASLPQYGKDIELTLLDDQFRRVSAKTAYRDDNGWTIY